MTTPDTEKQASVLLVRATQRTPPDVQTQGMTREQAFNEEDAWVGTVRTDPEMASGWHHHDNHDTYIYVLEGRLQIEFGPAGEQKVDASPGDFIRVPPHVVHRERNPETTHGEAVVIRFGTGKVTVNVDGPETS